MPDSSANRWICAQVGDRHEPGDDRQVAAPRRDPVAQPEVVVGVEEELGDREVGAGVGLARRARRASWSRSGDSGCPSGNAATPTQKSPRPLTSATSSSAWSSPSGCGVHGAARAAGRVAAQRQDVAHARRRRTRRRPGAARRREAPTQVRCAIGVSVVSRGDPLGDADGAVAGRAAGAVGDGHERRAAAARAGGSPATARARPRRPWAGRTRTRTSGRSAASSVRAIDRRHVLGLAQASRGCPVAMPGSARSEVAGVSGPHLAGTDHRDPAGGTVARPSGPPTTCALRVQRAARRRGLRPRRRDASWREVGADGTMRPLRRRGRPTCCAAASGCGRRSATGAGAAPAAPTATPSSRPRPRSSCSRPRADPRRRDGRQRHPPRAARPRTGASPRCTREQGWAGDPRRASGSAGAILAGDLCLAWADELLRRLAASPPAALARGRAVFDRCAPS